MLEEAEALPEPGVWTGAALLRNTSYADRIQARGIKIDIVS